MKIQSLVFLCCVVLPGLVYAEKPGQWGSAKDVAIEYKPSRVVYDVTSGRPGHLANILDRVSLLSSLYGADPFESSIVVVLHGDVIPLFSIKEFEKNKELMTRAYNQALSGVVEFRMCKASAQFRYALLPKDIQGFVNMVPMADAEIIRLQNEESYAYMR